MRCILRDRLHSCCACWSCYGGGIASALAGLVRLRAMPGAGRRARIDRRHAVALELVALLEQALRMGGVRCATSIDGRADGADRDVRATTFAPAWLTLRELWGLACALFVVFFVAMMFAVWRRSWASGCGRRSSGLAQRRHSAVRPDARTIELLSRALETLTARASRWRAACCPTGMTALRSQCSRSARVPSRASCCPIFARLDARLISRTRRRRAGHAAVRRPGWLHWPPVLRCSSRAAEPSVAGVLGAMVLITMLAAGCELGALASGSARVAGESSARP